MSKGWNAIIVSPDPKVFGDIEPIFTQQLTTAPIVEVAGYPTARTLTEIQQNGEVNLCFLDMMADLPRALLTITDLLSIAPGMKVVTLLPENNPNLILQCLRQGASEFLVHPFTAEQMQSVMARLDKLNPHIAGGNSNGKVICVVPVKGACGASTLAVNLSVQGKRLNKSHRALLADLDPVTGTVSFLLKLKSTYSFIDAMSHHTEMDLSIWKGMIVQSNNIDVLLPPENALEIPFELRSADQLLHFSRTNYESVVVDAGSAYGEWYLSMARLADEVVLVSTNELPALNATQRVLRYYEANQINLDKVRLVINRYSDNVGLSEDMIEMALHTPVYHVVPSDYDSVQRALLDGKPILSTANFGKSVAALAEKLIGKSVIEAKKPATGFANMISGFFSKK